MDSSDWNFLGVFLSVDCVQFIIWIEEKISYNSNGEQEGRKTWCVIYMDSYSAYERFELWKWEDEKTGILDDRYKSRPVCKSFLCNGLIKLIVHFFSCHF